MGVERKRLPLFSGTESVRAWVGRVAERAKQAPGMSLVGVRMGRDMKPKWQSGSLRVGVGAGYIQYTCVCVCLTSTIVQCDYSMDVSLCNPTWGCRTCKVDCRLSLHL